MAAQTTAPSTQRAVCTLWAVNRFSTGRRARALRAKGLKRGGHDGSKPQPPTRRGVGEEVSRPMTWRGARHELGAKTTAPSTQRAVRALWAVGCFSTGRRARRPRATRLEKTATTLRSHNHRPGAVWWRSTSANGVGWSTSRVGRADNRAKHAARSACVVGGRLFLHGTTGARAARHGTKERPLRHFEAAAATLVRCRWRRASGNGVG